ncbi:hypothetical protein FNYG_14103 [Fusarium nygamai]|uniref:Uncharacterized protein n=1 Tax=Gibberella nygamai TaxID=42673 RepID=A0A2K0UTS6_GIBNY|nr:hypothetical protein FNYG_14103 [Fusarium nygamai]
MTAIYENIDPDGDTLIIISYLAVPTQSADEPVAVEEPAAAVEPLAVEEPAVEEPTVEEPTVEEPTVEEPTVEEPTVEEPAAAVEPLAVEEPVAAYAPDHKDGHPTFSSIDGTTHCHEGLVERLPEMIFPLV